MQSITRIQVPGKVRALLVGILLMVLLAPRAAVRAEEGGFWDFLTGARVAMVTGAPFEAAVREKNPQVGEILYFVSSPDMIAAARADKVDAFVNNEAIGTLITK